MPGVRFIYTIGYTQENCVYFTTVDLMTVGIEFYDVSLLKSVLYHISPYIINLEKDSQGIQTMVYHRKNCALTLAYIHVSEDHMQQIFEEMWREHI